MISLEKEMKKECDTPFIWSIRTAMIPVVGKGVTLWHDHGTLTGSLQNFLLFRDREEGP